MPRYMLTEELWSKLREILLQFSLYNKAGLRKTVEGILFRMRTGVPWRDLPEHFGKWNSVYKAFNCWSKKGIWKKLFNVLKTDSDLEWVFIDGSYVKAHQHSAGAAGGYDSQIIRDKGEALGMSVIIPRRKNSIKGNKGLDWHLYKLRHLVENAFARLKHYRAVATRYDKLARNYASIVSLACAFLWLPM